MHGHLRPGIALCDTDTQLQVSADYISYETETTSCCIAHPKYNKTYKLQNEHMTMEEMAIWGYQESKTGISDYH